MKGQLVVAAYSNPVNPASALLRGWWDKMETWAKELKVPPNEISGRFKEKPKGLISNNGYNLVKYRSRFAAQVEANNLEELGLACLSPEWRYKAIDWHFEADYGRFSSAWTIFLAGVNVEQLRRVPDISMSAFTKNAVDYSQSYLSIKYALAVAMPMLFMAGGYAIGLASGELPEEMIFDTNAWTRFSGKECDRTLRNVYGYNILTAKHLDIPIGGQRLEDWIKASDRRGKIERLGEGLFLWTFQEDDDQEAFLTWDYPPVVRVREELKRYEIFPWQAFARQRLGLREHR